MMEEENYSDPNLSGSDDEMDEEVSMNEEGEEGEEQRSLKKQKVDLNDPSLDFSAPTSEELANLAATQQLFKSNLLKLQINELLEAVSVDYNKVSKIETCLRTLKTIIDDMPSKKKIHLPAGSKSLGVSLHRQGELEMKFHRPRVDLIGSYLLKTLVKPDLGIDVCVTMPMECFQLKDHINYRYIDKRAAYLNHLATYLNKREEFASSVHVSTFRGDPLKPILVLRRPKNAKKGTSVIPKGYSIRIYVGVPSDLVPLRKLGPLRNAVRSCKVGEDLVPTPYYNQSIAEDMTLVDHLKYLHPFLSNCEAYEEAVKLLKVWIYQRGLHSCGFNGFIFSLLISHLDRERKVNAQMSSYQVFRAVMQLLSEERLSLSLYQEGTSSDEVPSLSEFERVFPVVVIDPTGFVNAAYRITESVWVETRAWARLSLSSLDDANSEGTFSGLFLQKLPFDQRFDNYFDIDMTKRFPKKRETNDFLSISQRFQKPVPVSSILLPARDAYVCTCEHIITVLSKAFTDRVTKMSVEYKKDEEWPLGAPGLNSRFQRSIRIGVCIDPISSRRDVDRGPPADSKTEAEEYRDLWGELSELRRFQDGAIVEAVVWEVEEHEKHLIMKQIAEAIISRHIGLSVHDVKFIGHQLDFALKYNKYIVNEKSLSLSLFPTSVSRSIKDAFKDLSDRIRNLPDLPLTMLSIQAVDSVFCDTSPFPPQKKDLSSLDVTDLTSANTPIEVLIQFERSSNWPDDLNALRRVKTAFYLKIGSLFKAHFKIPSKVAHEWVDIFIHGFVFRVRIYNEREIFLQKVKAEEDAVKELGPKAVIDNRLHVPKIPAFKGEINLELRPQHVNLMRGINLAYRYFGETAQLAKRWVSAHLFSSELCDEAVELLVAQCFISPSPFDIPASPLQGFRRFLSLIAAHDWKEEPLVVNVNDKLTPEISRDIREEFDKARKAKRGALMYIATPHDPFCMSWTHSSPKATVLSQIVLYAQSTEQQISSILSSPETAHQTSPWKGLFRTPLRDFDLFITLRDEVLPGREQALHLMRKKGEKEHMKTNNSIEEKKKRKRKTFKAPPTARDMEEGPSPADLEKIAALVVGFSPVDLFVRDLRRQFHRHALFYYDRYGTNLIAVRFKKESFEQTHLTVSNAPYKAPLLDKKGSAVAVIPNMDEILAEIRQLGKGVVKDVYVDFVEYSKNYGASH